MTDRIFCHFGLFPANPNFEKMKKAPGNVFIYTSVP